MEPGMVVNPFVQDVPLTLVSKEYLVKICLVDSVVALVLKDTQVMVPEPDAV
jgi:hypothetical protein